MSDFTQTPNLGLYKPTYNADAEQWGNHLNTNADKLDAAISSIPGGSTGGFLPTAGGTMIGPLNYTATGGTVSRSAQNRAADGVNALDFGADPTGATDSAPFINAALALGRPTYLPHGNYRVKSALNVGPRIDFYGAGRNSTYILVDQTFSSTDPGIIVLTGREDQSPIVRDLTIAFQQPTDQASRANFKTLAAGGTSVQGGSGVRYPPAILSSQALYPSTSANRFKIQRIQVQSAWDGIWSDSGCGFITEIEMGALDVGLNLLQCRDTMHVSHLHFWNFGFNSTQALYTGVYRDGNTYAARFGEGGGCDGISITDFVSSSGRVLINDSRTTGMWEGIAIGDGGSFDCLNCGNIQITNLNLTGTPDSGNPNSILTHGGGTLELTNLFGGSTRLMVNHTAGILVISGGSIGSNGFPNQPCIVQTGGQLYVLGSLVQVNDAAFGAWTVPIIQSTGGNGLTVAGCVFPPNHSGSQQCIACVDNAANFIAGNNFNGRPFTPPVAGGTAALGFYNFNSDGRISVGDLGIPGQVSFIRADDGFSRGYVGFTADSTAVTLVNNSGTNPTVSLNAAQSYGKLSFQINGTERINLTSTGMAFPILPANAANDAAAAAAGVPVGGSYRNGSVLQVRVT